MNSEFHEQSFEVAPSEEFDYLLFAEKSPRDVFSVFLVYGIVAVVLSYVIGTYFLQGLVHRIVPDPSNVPIFLRQFWWFSGSISVLILGFFSSCLLGSRFASTVGARSFRFVALVGFLSAFLPGVVFFSLMTPEQITDEQTVNQLYQSDRFRGEWIKLSFFLDNPTKESESFQAEDIAGIEDRIVLVNGYLSGFGFSSRFQFVVFLRLVGMPVVCLLGSLVGALFFNKRHASI